MVPGDGFEPSPAGPQPAALPLSYARDMRWPSRGYGAIGTSAQNRSQQQRHKGIGRVEFVRRKAQGHQDRQKGDLLRGRAVAQVWAGVEPIDRPEKILHQVGHRHSPHRSIRVFPGDAKRGLPDRDLSDRLQRENSSAVSCFTFGFPRMRHGAPHRRRDDPTATASQETTMFAKTLIAALVLAGTSLTFVASASAAPKQQGPSQAEQSYLSDRHNPADTN